MASKKDVEPVISLLDLDKIFDITEYAKITIPSRKIICKSCRKEYESYNIEVKENPENLERCYFKCEECGTVNNLKRVLTIY